MLFAWYSDLQVSERLGTPDAVVLRGVGVIFFVISIPAFLDSVFGGGGAVLGFVQLIQWVLRSEIIELGPPHTGGHCRDIG